MAKSKKKKDVYGLVIPSEKASLSVKKEYLEKVERRKEDAAEKAKVDAKIKAATKGKK